MNQFIFLCMLAAVGFVYYKFRKAPTADQAPNTQKTVELNTELKLQEQQTKDAGEDYERAKEDFVNKYVKPDNGNNGSSPG